VAMLVQARDKTVRLLPALPGQWPSGRIEGALLRGGIRVDELDWNPDRVVVRLTGPDSDITVIGPRGSEATVRLGQRLEMEA
jgi:alpha-L-fucosidase 2